MKKLPILIWTLSAISLCAEAKDIDLVKAGAKADGRTKVTKVLQKSIDEVSKAGGGRVVLSGGTFLVTPFELKSGVDLHIAADAVLLGSPDLDDYVDRDAPRHYESASMPRKRNVALIYADEASNIAISGRGIIDCNGTYFVKAKEGNDWKGWPYVRSMPQERSLPRVVFFAGCTDVSISDVTMRNQPAGWSYWIHDCDRVMFQRCRILADVRYPNNDGIHLNCSRDVTVSDCIIETGDDSIVIRANSRSLRENKPCERVTVTNCILRSWSAGIRFGWTGDGTIRCCTLSNLVLYDCPKGVAFKLPSYGSKTNNDYGRESTLIEDISFSNVVMDKVICPVQLMVEDADDVPVEAIRRIRFSHMDVSSLYRPIFKGREDCPIEDVSFEDCSFRLLPESSFPNLRQHGAIPAKVADAHVKRISFDGCSFSTAY